MRRFVALMARACVFTCRATLDSVRYRSLQSLASRRATPMTNRTPFATVVALISIVLLPATGRAVFPPGFLWGTAISGFQNEAGGAPSNGDPGSDWWVWTRDANNITNDWVSGDLPEQGPGFWD